MQDAHAQLTFIPVAGRIDERTLVQVPVLTEQVHVVSEPHERLGQARVVHVGARAVEQIAVEDQHPHRAAA